MANDETDFIYGEDLDAILLQEYRRMERRDWWLALRAVIKQRGKEADDIPQSRLPRWAYTVKAIVCLLMRRTGGLNYRNNILCFAYWDLERHSHPEAPSQATGWTALELGIGWKNWRYQIYTDTSY